MAARIRTPLLSTQPVSEPQGVEYLLTTLDERVDCHPVYQRDIRWTQDNMCDLIETVMNSGLIPGLILYHLHSTDEKSKPSVKWECVDGQHRFFTLSHFFRGTLVELPGKKPFLISWNYRDSAGQLTIVFYKETDAIKAWIAENPAKKVAYMTEEERDHFNGFFLDVRKITNKLDLQQRREIFCSLQKGVPVRGSDLYKNYTHLRLVQFISEDKRWESELKEPMLAHLTIKPSQYWLHWVIRFFLILNPGETPVEEVFVKTDSEITRMMRSASPIFKTSPEVEEDLDIQVCRFFTFLENFPGVKMSPTHFYALFTHLASAQEGREEILLGHIASWSKDTVSALQRKMWENRGNISQEERQEYFLHCLTQLEKIRVPARPPSARKAIAKKVRDKVWRVAFSVNLDGMCYCCSDKITIDNWHQGHIISHACGGLDDTENLRPVCSSCNLSMGTENMDDFKKRHYPQRK